MARVRELVWACALVLLGSGVSAWGQVNANLSCTIQPSQQIPVRAEGVTELVGDIGFICTGAPSTPAGSPIPTYTISVTLNCPLTSRVFTDHLSEALLIVDEAYPSQPNPSAAPRWPGSGSPQNLCRAAGPNACPMLGTGIVSGDPGGDYDGASGHYNVFEGVVSAFNTVSFIRVPLDSPDGYLYLRITNIRADAAELLTPPFTSAQVEAVVNGLPVLGGGFVFLNAFVGLAESSMTVTQTPPAAISGTSYTTLSVTFSENFDFPTAFKTVTDLKNAGPQNVPGFAYNSESGLWDKLTPPLGIAELGLANHGTRLMLHFSGYPAGVNIVGPSVAALSLPAGKTTETTGAVMYVATDANGNSTDGPKASSSKVVTVTTDNQGDAWLTYEVVGSDPAAAESVTIPVIIESQSIGTVTGSYGPLASSGTAPIPRFVQQH